jgi:hypothetical protein
MTSHQKDIGLCFAGSYGRKIDRMLRASQPKQMPLAPIKSAHDHSQTTITSLLVEDLSQADLLVRGPNRT